MVILNLRAMYQQVAMLLYSYIFMPDPSTGPKIFWAGPNLLGLTKN